MNTLLRTSLLAATLVLGGAPPIVNGQAPGDPKVEKPAVKKPSSLDDELFQDLDLGKKPAVKPAAKPDANPAGEAKSTASREAEPSTGPAPAKRSPLDEELLRQLGGDEETTSKKKPPQSRGTPTGGPDRSEERASDNPLVRLSRQVRDAERRLREADSGDETQEVQRKIVDDLEKLIAQIEQQQQSQSKSQSKKPGAQQQGQRNQPQPQPGKQPGQQAEKPTDSGEQLADRKNEKPQTGKLKDMLEKVWGELPERQRQDVMQASFDDFPVKYQYVIEEYFKLLLKRQE